MYQLLEERTRRLSDAKQADVVRGGKKGLEKESLRVTPDGHIAQTPHPVALGAALTHPSITTDYSEALLEFITPPYVRIDDALHSLDQIHRFVYQNIGDELLWATSMPCIVDGEKSIPLANYGRSNVGRMKHVYRRGLEVRYGRTMQAISGVHFNYSVNPDLWPVLWEHERTAGRAREHDTLQAFISASYFALARNMLRYEWLIAYLLGCSPALCKSFFGGATSDFQEFDAHTLYEPYATSLRMSDIGYKNKNQSSLKISYNMLEEYIAGLNYAISTPYPPFVAKGVIVNGDYQQLNANILQIANEYYSGIRPKQPTFASEKPTTALRKRGVQYVELRAVDVNAFSPIGVTRPHMHFLEALLIFCLLHESPPLDDDERQLINYNQTVVARQGRQPQLHLQRRGREQTLMSWGLELIDALAPLCAILDQGTDDQPYEVARQMQRAALEEPERTPSARMLAEMRTSGEAFARYALRISREHQQTILRLPQSPVEEQHFRAQARQSLAEQTAIEASDDIPFEEYLARYFAEG